MESLEDKINLIDRQIEKEEEIYKFLVSIEPYDIDKRESEIFQRIDKLQSAKTRLITGEKLPEKVYVDREVVKYIDKETKFIHVYRSSLVESLLWFIILIHISILSLWYFRIFELTFKLNF